MYVDIFNNVCVYIFIYIYVCVYIYVKFVFATWHIHICDLCVCVCVCVCMCARARARAHAYVSVYCVCVCICVCVYVCIHLCARMCVIHICDMKYSSLRHDSFRRVTWLTHVWETSTQSCVRYIFHMYYIFLHPCMCVTWCVHTCNMTHAYMCAVTHSCICMPWLRHFIFFFAKGLIHVCDIDHP